MSDAELPRTAVLPPGEAGRPADVLDPWSPRQVLRDYWRVPVAALLAALVAFVGSFAVSPTFAAGSTVLVRGRDSTVLSATGAPLDQQPGVIDSQLATALGDTQVALLSNSAVAERIVDELDLDTPRPDTPGAVAALRRFAKGVYKRTRAYLTYGYYAEPEPRAAAIAGVQAGLSAERVDDGFALHVIATADDPGLTAAIANAAADVLVATSGERLRAEAAAQEEFLQAQTDQALADERSARSRLSDYRTRNGIVTTPVEDARLLQQSEDELAVLVRTTQAELQGVRARAGTLRERLRTADASATNDQQIVTGRSRTQISTTSPNPAYAELFTEVQRAEAEATAVAARLQALEQALDAAQGAEVSPASAQDAELSRLQLDVQIAAQTRAGLAEELQTASLNAQRPTVELTRIDQASAPLYPVSPKRYLFLGVGLLLGGLASFVWCFLRVERRRRLAALGLQPTLHLPSPRQVQPEEDAGLGILTGHGPAQSGSGPPPSHR